MIKIIIVIIIINTLTTAATIAVAANNIGLHIEFLGLCDTVCVLYTDPIRSAFMQPSANKRRHSCA